MIVYKWHSDTRKYTKVVKPKKLILTTDNMELETICANCEKPLLFGNSYPSRVYHTENGLGYPVCSECYVKETN